MLRAEPFFHAMISTMNQEIDAVFQNASTVRLDAGQHITVEAGCHRLSVYGVECQCQQKLARIDDGYIWLAGPTPQPVQPAWLRTKAE